MNTPTAHDSPLRQPGPRRLVRTPDRKITGVAAGIAHYLGVDPTVIRILFLALLFAGGLGLVLYVICWIAMPAGERSETRRGEALDAWGVVGIVGLVIGIWLMVGWHGIGNGARAVAAIALIIGGALLIRRQFDPGARSRPEPDGGLPVSPPPPPPPSAPTSHSAPEAETEVRLDTGARGAPAEAIEGGSTQHANSRPEAAEAASGHHRALTGGVLSLLALVIAGVVAGTLSDWFDVQASLVIAVALVVVGAGLVGASVVGRAPWLFVFGFLLTGALVTSAAVEPIVDRGVGERTVAPTSLAELAPVYRLGMGELKIDLSQLQIEGVVDLKVDLDFGAAEVIVPPHVDVEVHGKVLAGVLETPSGKAEGVDKRLDTVDDLETADRLRLDLDVTFGEGVVRRG